jgi:hypothetical protein
MFAVGNLSNILFYVCPKIMAQYFVGIDLEGWQSLPLKGKE